MCIYIYIYILISALLQKISQNIQVHLLFTSRSTFRADLFIHAKQSVHLSLVRNLNFSPLKKGNI